MSLPTGFARWDWATVCWIPSSNPAFQLPSSSCSHSGMRSGKGRKQSNYSLGKRGRLVHILRFMNPIITRSFKGNYDVIFLVWALIDQSWHSYLDIYEECDFLLFYVMEINGKNTKKRSATNLLMANHYFTTSTISFQSTYFMITENT